MSNETKWTPGPWAVYADDEVFSRGAKTEQGFPVVVVPDSGAFEFEYGDTMAIKPQCRANAHLIAAAPELFEALLVAREYLQGFVSTTIREPDIDNLERVDAALAKARGDQP